MSRDRENRACALALAVLAAAASGCFGGDESGVAGTGNGGAGTPGSGASGGVGGVTGAIGGVSGGVAIGGTTAGAGSGAGSGGAGGVPVGGTSAGGSGVTGGTGVTGGSGGSSGSGGAGGSGGCGDCSGHTCCDGACVNLQNDTSNCGGCGNECLGDRAYCDRGECGLAPCDAGTACGGATCCGADCCAAGEICCEIPGPIGSSIACVPPTDKGTCPMGCVTCKCNSPDTPVATPDGERPIASLRVGDLVFSVDGDGVRAVPVAAVSLNPVARHEVVRLTLDTGAMLEVSAEHPLADGRAFGDLRAGETLDGVRVVATERVAYRHAFTYDVLPASSTGTYYAAGVLMRSTLHP